MVLHPNIMCGVAPPTAVSNGPSSPAGCSNDYILVSSLLIQGATRVSLAASCCSDVVQILSPKLFHNLSASLDFLIVMTLFLIEFSLVCFIVCYAVHSWEHPEPSLLPWLFHANSKGCKALITPSLVHYFHRLNSCFSSEMTLFPILARITAHTPTTVSSNTNVLNFKVTYYVI